MASSSTSRGAGRRLCWCGWNWNFVGMHVAEKKVHDAANGLKWFLAFGSDLGGVILQVGENRLVIDSDSQFMIWFSFRRRPGNLSGMRGFSVPRMTGIMNLLRVGRGFIFGCRRPRGINHLVQFPYFLFL